MEYVDETIVGEFWDVLLSVVHPKKILCSLDLLYRKREENNAFSGTYIVDFNNPISDYKIEKKLKLKVNWEGGYSPSFEDSSSFKEDLPGVYSEYVRTISDALLNDIEQKRSENSATIAWYDEFCMNPKCRSLFIAMNKYYDITKTL